LPVLSLLLVPAQPLAALWAARLAVRWITQGWLGLALERSVAALAALLAALAVVCWGALAASQETWLERLARWKVLLAQRRQMQPLPRQRRLPRMRPPRLRSLRPQALRH
jgi:hypothetical protein